MEENTQRFGEILLEPETEAEVPFLRWNEDQDIKDNLWPTYEWKEQSQKKDVALVAWSRITVILFDL